MEATFGTTTLLLEVVPHTKIEFDKKSGLSYSLCAYVHSALHTPNHHIVSIARLYGFFAHLFIRHLVG